jgi:hypothetical protein
MVIDIIKPVPIGEKLWGRLQSEDIQFEDEGDAC